MVPAIRLPSAIARAAKVAELEPAELERLLDAALGTPRGVFSVGWLCGAVEELGVEWGRGAATRAGESFKVADLASGLAVDVACIVKLCSRCDAFARSVSVELLRLARAAAADDPAAVRAIEAQLGLWASRTERRLVGPAPAVGRDLVGELRAYARDRIDQTNAELRDADQRERRAARRLPPGRPGMSSKPGLVLLAYVLALFRVSRALALLRDSRGSKRLAPVERRRRIAEACAIPVGSLSAWDDAGNPVHGHPARRASVRRAARELVSAVFPVVSERQVANILTMARKASKTP